MTSYNRLCPQITTDILRKIAPRMSGARAAAQAKIIERTSRSMPAAQRAAALFTPLRLAHFIAQLAHESDGFCTISEYASGAAYEGRKDLGNLRHGDGKRFKGRGLIQVTGRKNYAAYTKWLAENRSAIPCNAPPNFEYRPDLAADFPFAVMSGSFYWQVHNINAFADKDDLAAITNIINCGRVACVANGGHSRAQYLARAKAVLGVSGSAEEPRWDTVEGLNAALGA